eukprot:g1181.t1
MADDAKGDGEVPVVEASMEDAIAAALAAMSTTMTVAASAVKLKEKKTRGDGNVAKDEGDPRPAAKPEGALGVAAEKPKESEKIVPTRPKEFRKPVNSVTPKASRISNQAHEQTKEKINVKRTQPNASSKPALKPPIDATSEPACATETVAAAVGGGQREAKKASRPLDRKQRVLPKPQSKTSLQQQQQKKSKNILITKETYANMPARQEGERTKKMNDYQLKEYKKQLERLTKLKDENSTLQAFDIDASTDAIENAGVQNKAKSDLGESITDIEQKSREQLHYHKVLNRMNARLIVELKTNHAKSYTLAEEEKEAGKELAYLSLQRSRLMNVAEVAEFELVKQREENAEKRRLQKEKMRQIKVEIDDLESMVELHRKMEKRLEETRKQALGDLTADAEIALVQAATGSRFKSSYLTITNEYEKKLLTESRRVFAKFQKACGLSTTKDILALDESFRRHLKTLPERLKETQKKIKNEQSMLNLHNSDLDFLSKHKDNSKAGKEEMRLLLDKEINVLKTKKSTLKELQGETDYIRNIMLKVFRSMRALTTKLGSMRSKVYKDEEVLKNVLPPYSDEQVKQFFKNFETECTLMERKLPPTLPLDRTVEDSKQHWNKTLDECLNPFQATAANDSEEINECIKSMLKMGNDALKKSLEQ